VETFVKLLFIIWLARYVMAAFLIIALVWLFQFLDRHL